MPRYSLDIHKQHITATLRSSFMLFLFLHRGLIASGFTETHYLQDGTDVSLIRNYTVSHACLDHHDTLLSNLCLNSSCFILSKVTAWILHLDPKTSLSIAYGLGVAL